MTVDCIEDKIDARLKWFRGITALIIVLLALPWVLCSIYWVCHAIGVRWVAYTNWVEGFFK